MSNQQERTVKILSSSLNETKCSFQSLDYVKKIHPGSDDIMHSAIITTAKGIIIRPFSKLAILSLNN